MNIDSTNMNPELMMNIAKAIKEYRDNYDGFVVAHGTDTMGYTAAALVYMLKNFNKPVEMCIRDRYMTHLYQESTLAGILKILHLLTVQ